MTKPILPHEAETREIHAIIRDYFDGLYEGDVEKLRSIFDEKASLQAPGYRRTRDEWLSLVAERSVPKAEGFGYDFALLSLEVVGDQAMAKVSAPLPAANYVDFLSLLKEEGAWKIVNKMFVAV